MKIEDVRLANLKSLINENGSMVDVAKESGVSAAYLNQIISGVMMISGLQRNVGSRLARKLEAGCGKPDGWMDVSKEVSESNMLFPHETWEKLNPADRELVNTVVSHIATNKLENKEEQTLLNAFRNCSAEARAVVISVAESQANSSKKAKAKIDK